MAVKFFKFVWEYFKISLQTAMEYRTNFFSQAGLMFVNNVIFLTFWIILINKFTSINSWQLSDIMLLHAIVALSWGLSGSFFGNFQNIAEIVRDGQLDFYLALPREELSHILVSKSKFSSFGDVLFGIGLAAFFLSWSQVPLFIICIICSVTLILSFAITLGSLSFYLGSSVEVSNQGMMGMLGVSSYPIDIFTGYTKFILLTIIPAGLISGVPVGLLKDFSFQWFFILIGITIVFAILAITLFKKGIKRYESGNLINVRM